MACVVSITRSRVKELEQHIKETYAIYSPDNFALNEDCQYPKKELLGKGSFSKVYKSCLEDEQTEVALKVLKLDISRKERSSLLMHREMLLSSKMNHNNIVKLIKICIHGEMRHEVLRNVFTLVMEFCITNLDFVLNSKIIVEDSERKSIIWQLLNGLAYIHRLNLMHRDLKPANLLINAEGTLKIADFGLTRLVSPERESQSLTRGTGTRPYKAPEMLFCSKIYDQSIDMWSVGCIMVDVWTNHPLFEADSCEEIRQMMVNFFGEINEESLPGRDAEFYSFLEFYKLTVKMEPRYKSGREFCSQSALELIEALLVLKPSERLTAEGALQHNHFTLPPDRSDNLLSIIDRLS